MELAFEHMVMDVERSSSPAPPPALAAEMDAVKGWRRIRGRARRALLAVCVMAATVLALLVLSAAGGGSATVPRSWFSVQDAPPSNLTADHLLDGLLTPEFSSSSCRSRYEFANYYHGTKKKHKPSPYLLAKLRRHEAFQKRCGPGTAPYRAAIRQLKSGDGTVVAGANGCRYLVSISYRGLGNRMLSTASAFLYAVLTERTLLVHQYHHDLGTLFCEPFPGTTWLLPSSGWLSGGFPLVHLGSYDIDSKESLGNMLRTNALSVGAHGNATWSDERRRPPYVYLHLEGDYGFNDKLFYCDEQQRLLGGAPWLVMKTDSYLVPGLFLVPSFEEELGRMFPEKDAAFHHLGRYLFHPANHVWRQVTAYHADHLAGARQRVGIQIRAFKEKRKPLRHVLDQVLSCVRREKLLLPAETTSSPSPFKTSNASSVDLAVLVTSLNSWYYERIRDEYAAAAGVRMHQPSHEGRQKWGDASHDGRALAEMYLLSTCDVLVTTGFSTFGYIAQGLGGVRPWIMPATPIWSPDTEVVPDPPCVRTTSVEPCFHKPSYYDCAARKDVDVGKVLPYIRLCEDVSWGIKIANVTSQW